VSHVIVVDLGYGDAGKGTVVDWLCSPRGGSLRGAAPVHTVVRFNGGAQAGHNVVTADGRHHTFAQFGSGTFNPGVRTHLSRFMLVDPLALAAEAGHLATLGVPDALARLTVDQDALLTTPYHRAANQARELARGSGRHGSCGMGIGETARYALSHPDEAPRAGDCAAPRALARKLALLRDWLAAELGELGVAAGAGGPAGARGPAGGVPSVEDLCVAYQAFAAVVPLTGPGYLAGVLRQGRAVFEGAQGVLLDEWRGFHPYTTWSTTTFGNAETLLAEAGQAAVRLGVVRSYLTRHGPGPFVTEDPTLELPEPHNRRGRWQGVFRTGHFDAVALRYAVEVAGGVDALALTHLDAVTGQPVRLCRRYLVDGQPVARLVPGPERDLAYQERLTAMLLGARPEYTEPSADWPSLAGQLLGAPVALVSRGPTAADKDQVAPLLDQVTGTWRRPGPVLLARASRAGCRPRRSGS
jgi:adenylosuccinate synthase